jgi:hypothetical protein
MFTAKKIVSIYKPKIFEPLNNGIWYYNYNIEEKTVKVLSIEREESEETEYSYVQVRISGEPTLAKCCEAILKAYKDGNNTSLYDTLLTEGINDQIEDINYNIKVDFNMAPEKSPLEKAKEEVTRAIEQYDTSDNVNSFSLNGVKVWLPKETRVGLMNSTTIEKNSGKEESTMWFNGICITVNCDAAIQMLSSLELYALACYNKTAEHKLAVSQLTEVSEVKAYDYTAGYPDKLSFTI